MVALLCFFLTLFASPFKSKSRLEAENSALRHRLIVLQRRVSGRIQLTNGDRLFLVMLYRWFPSILQAITIIRPETLVRWHRAGFRRYWRWKSRAHGGRPQVGADLRALIQRMSVDNALWGAPRIHGELLKLGFEVSQSSVIRGSPTQQLVENRALDIRRKSALDGRTEARATFSQRERRSVGRTMLAVSGSGMSSTSRAAANPSTAAAGTRECNSKSASAFQMGPPLIPFTGASAARA
jgi:hypothetical protein